MEKDLHVWSMPRVPTRKNFRQKWFHFFKDYKTKTVSDTITLTNEDIILKLLRSKEFQNDIYSRNLSNKYLHIGLVQIGVKPLTRQSQHSSIVLSLRDARHMDFRASLLSLVESDLSDGSIYFNCFANLMVPLDDEMMDHVLTVNLKTKGDEEAMTSGVEHLVFSFRIYYRVMGSPFADNALKESSMGETTVYQPNGRVSKSNKWDDIQIPTNWLERHVPSSARSKEKVTIVFCVETDVN